MRIKYCTLIVAAVWGTPYSVFADTSDQEKTEALPEVKVTATNDKKAPSEKTKSYTVKSTATATRLDTSIRDTPQSISVINRQQIDDFKLTEVNDLLDMATGIKVDRLETDRTSYNARGSEITNFQVDGFGTPFAINSTLLSGNLDTAIYDRVEVLRGANGLLSGTGNPSATINFVRKRPTADFRAKINLSAGSWDNRRLESDVSGSINDSGSVRGRIVLVHQDRNTYLDRYSVERNVASGIIEADISDNTTVTFGHTYHQNNANSPLWGALPLQYSDGTKRHYSRSDSSAADWAYANTLTNRTFAELSHLFSNGWEAKAQLTRNEVNGDWALSYLIGNENPVTGTGLMGYPRAYKDTSKDLIADAYLKGPFSFAGREHELVIGTSWSRSTHDQTEYADPSLAFGIVVLGGFDDAANYPKPTFSPSGRFAAIDVKRSNTYAATKLNMTDDLKVTVGANLLTYRLSGNTYGTPFAADANNKITPYIGAVYSLNDIHSLYTSYTGIYQPQVRLDANFQPLEPVKGKNYEAGLKSEFFNKKFNTTFAVFKTSQENVAEQFTSIPTALYRGLDIDTKGYEFDVSGEVTDNLQISGGYTRLASLQNKDDDNVQPYIPRQTFKLSSAYKVPGIEKLRVGASLNWQSKIHTDDTGLGRYYQDSYAVVNAMANYEINSHWSAALNIYNLTDQKYLQSLYWGQSYYAAPRSAMATVTWTY